MEPAACTRSRYTGCPNPRAQARQVPSGMRAAPRRLRVGRGVHVRGGAAEKHAHISLVLLCCVGTVALLSNAGRALFAKEKLCLGSSGCISLALRTSAPKSEGIKFELHTLPVDAKDVADGDTITVYVDVAGHLESIDLRPEVHTAATEQSKAQATENSQRSDSLERIILDAGYRQVPSLRGEQVLVKKYGIRLRGINTPESLMPFGKEAKEELVKLVKGKRLKILVYDNDRYGRLVGDVDCNGVFVQEHMLKIGLAWHYTAYDHRMELSKWENMARSSGAGLWALPNPEKPWEWRKKKRIGTV